MRFPKAHIIVVTLPSDFGSTPMPISTVIGQTMETVTDDEFDSRFDTNSTSTSISANAPYLFLTMSVLNKLLSPLMSKLQSTS